MPRTTLAPALLPCYIILLVGMTEARRVVAMAAAHDILVIPHGSSVYSYHLQV